MIKKKLFNKILKLVSILSIALTLSLMTFSFTAFAFTVGPSTAPKPIVTTTFDIKGLGLIPTSKIKITFDSGEIFNGVVDSAKNYSVNVTYPHITGVIQIEEIDSTGAVIVTSEFKYDITKFNTDNKGYIIGPVIFSGVGEIPNSSIDITFPNGETIPVKVDSKGNYTVSPTFPSPSGNATSTGSVPTFQYEGGITSVAASQVPPQNPNPSPAPDPGIKPVATATSTAAASTASTATKATVRSGGFLQIAGIIALFTVILAILIINKKFKR
jgi:hypothetical protein